MILATLVNWGQLLESVVAGSVSAIVLTIVVSFGIRGMAKYVDYHQEGRVVLAYGSLAVGGISVILTLGLIVLGIYLMVAG